jgi:hypothetical protein
MTPLTAFTLVAVLALLATTTTAVAANDNDDARTFTCTPMPLPNEKAVSDPTVRINIRLGAGRHIGIRYIGQSGTVVDGGDVYDLQAVKSEHDASGRDVVHWWGRWYRSPDLRTDGYLHVSTGGQSPAGEYHEYISNGGERLIVYQARCYEVPE